MDSHAGATSRRIAQDVRRLLERFRGVVRLVVAVRLDDSDVLYERPVAEELAAVLRAEKDESVVVSAPFELPTVEALAENHPAIVVAVRSRWVEVAPQNVELAFLDVERLGHHEANATAAQSAVMELDLDAIDRALAFGLGLLDPVVSLIDMESLRESLDDEDALLPLKERPKESLQLSGDDDEPVILLASASQLATGALPSAMDLEETGLVWSAVARRVSSSEDLGAVRAVVHGLRTRHPRVASSVLQAGARSIVKLLAATGTPLMRRVWCRLALELHLPNLAAACLLLRRNEVLAESGIGDVSTWGPRCEVDQASVVFGEPVLETLLLRTAILQEYHRENRTDADRAERLLNSYERLLVRVNDYPPLFHTIANGLADFIARTENERNRVGAIEGRLDELAMATTPPFNRRFAVMAASRAIRRGDRNGSRALLDMLEESLKPLSGDADASRRSASTLTQEPLTSTWLYVQHAEAQFAQRFSAGSGDLDLADKLYEDVLRLDPANVPALTARGALAGERGHIGAASNVLERALEADPGNPVALLTLSQLRKDVELLKRAIERDPHEVRFRTALSKVYRELERPAEAIAVLDKVDSFARRNPYVVAERLALASEGAPLPVQLQALADELASDYPVVHLALLRRRGSTIEQWRNGPLADAVIGAMPLLDRVRTRNTYVRHFSAHGRDVWGAQLARAYVEDPLNRYTLALRKELGFFRPADESKLDELITTLHDKAELDLDELAQVPLPLPPPNP